MRWVNELGGEVDPTALGYAQVQGGAPRRVAPRPVAGAAAPVVLPAPEQPILLRAEPARPVAPRYAPLTPAQPAIEPPGFLANTMGYIGDLSGRIADAHRKGGAPAAAGMALHGSTGGVVALADDVASAGGYGL